MSLVTPCRCGCDTEDRVTKIQHAHMGRTFSAATRARMSEGQRRRAVRPLDEAELLRRQRVGRPGRKHPSDCGHCAAMAGSRNPRFAGWSSLKSLRERLRPGAALDGTVTRRRVLERDAWKCWICEESIPDTAWVQELFQPEYGTVDHVVPVSEGGGHTWENVRAAHLWCNAKRWYESRR